jgi:cell division protein FtsB
MNSTRFPRLLLAVVPALVIGAVAVSTLWGENGLYARHDLQAELVDAHAELGKIERENQRMLRELRMLERDPVVIERAVADELQWAREGTTLYRFDDDVK